MRAAYVDTSVIAAIAFDEPEAAAALARLEEFDLLVASDLLDAELRAALRREGAAPDPALTARLSWLLPDRPLRVEIDHVLQHGPVRGADCWHLAVALYLIGSPNDLTFLTLDQRQQRVAQAIGFAV